MNLRRGDPSFVQLLSLWFDFLCFSKEQNVFHFSTFIKSNLFYLNVLPACPVSLGKLNTLEMLFHLTLNTFSFKREMHNKDEKQTLKRPFKNYLQFKSVFDNFNEQHLHIPLFSF